MWTPACADMFWKPRSAVPPLHVGSFNEMPDVITFLSCFPGFDWLGSIHRATKQAAGPDDGPADYAMHIKCSGRDEPIFRLYYWANFRKMTLYFRPSVLDELPPSHVLPNKARIYSLFGLTVRRSWGVFHLELPPPLDGVFNDEKPFHGHPYVVLGRRINSRWAQGVVDQSSLIYFPFILRKLSKKRQKRDRQRKDPILAALQNFGPGSMKVYTSPNTKFHMEVLDRTRSLFGLTWVFPWAVHMLTAIRPNCLMTDATFQILAPYILEILHVICANESIPIAIAVFPTETLQSYDLLYSHVRDVLERAGADPKILCQIPLVSDQGAALHALVTKYALHWLLCHRHLIEKVGSSTQIGDWVARILRCSSISEFKRVSTCIQLEIAAIQRRTPPGISPVLTNKRLHVLNMMLGLETADDLHVPARWARWERLGCPTTSNAAESMHAKLNARTRETRTFLGRLEIVMDVLFKRYDERNTDARVRRRSANRFLDAIADPRRMRIADNPDSAEFLSRLNSLVGEPGPRANWRFPEPTAPSNLKEFLVEGVDSLPPDSWQHDVHDDVPIDKVTPPELEDATVPLSIEVMEGQTNCATTYVNESYHRTGWEIILTMKRLVPPSFWKEKWAEINTFVFASGAAFRPQGQGIVKVEDEATWRDIVAENFGRCLHSPP
jgi:hypothetical protein